MKKVWITSDCTCDMSEELLNEFEVEVIHFYITTDHGCFKDMAEITANNVVEYFDGGGYQISTAAPAPYEYADFFRKMLEQTEEIVHIAIGSALSMSYHNAVVAAEQFGGRVHVVDSQHLSTGIAHLVIRAVELARAEKTPEEIVSEIERVRTKVSTTFIAENADYLFRTGRVSKLVKKVCSALKIHPVLVMKNGDMKLKTVQIGGYEESVAHYVKSELRKKQNIVKDRMFITYTTCPLKVVNSIKKQVNELCPFDSVMETRASATITSNCGANTVGVLFVRK